METLLLDLSLNDIGLLLIIGIFTGILAGLFGVGGGVIVVPALIHLFNQFQFPAELVVHLAIGSSLATIVFTSIAAIMGHHKRNAVIWPLVRLLTPGVLIGAWLGALVAGMLAGDWLQRLFALFLLLLAFQMLINRQITQHYQLPGRGTLFAVGGGIGMLSSIVGIGGGTLTVPFLAARGTPMPNAVATSSACGLSIAIAGSLGFVASGWGLAHLPPGSSGYIFWPAVVVIVASSILFASVGVRLAHFLPPTVTKRLFALLLLLVSGKLFMG